MSIRRWSITIFTIAAVGVVLTLVAWALPVACPAADGIPCPDASARVPAVLRGLIGIVAVAFIGGVLGWRIGGARVLVLVILVLSAAGSVVSVLAATGFAISL